MEKVECIVVGGGLAGLAAAYGLARDGVEVMVLERGNYSGSKNVTGGRLYVRPLRRIYPELWEDAPFERPVARELITMLGDGAATTVELASERFSAPSPQSYTVQRARFDQWLADKATAAGAMIVTDMKADELLRDGDKVIGVRAGGDEVGAEVTIVAEGVLGLLAGGAGLREKPRAADHAVGFKEVIELPPGVIEDRWRLNEGEGAAQLFMGEVTRGMTGGGFFYTNRASIALGCRGQHGADARARRRARIVAASRRFQGCCPDQAAGARRRARRILGARRLRGRPRQASPALRRRLPAGRRGRRFCPQRHGHRARHGPGRSLRAGRRRGRPWPPAPPATRRPPPCRSTIASCARPSSWPP